MNKTKLHNIICLPSLAVHELLHIIVTLLVGSKWVGIEVQKFDCFKESFGFSFAVYSISKYKWQNTAICMAPYLAFLIVPIVVIFNPALAFGILIYQAISFKVITPSNVDYESMREFRTDDELIEEMNQ